MFTLPNLPYAHNALEPHVDALTMEIHHGKHHQAYVNNLNAAIEGNTCVVTFFLDSTSELSGQSVEALSVLAESGLTPPLQFNARRG